MLILKYIFCVASFLLLVTSGCEEESYFAREYPRVRTVPPTTTNQGEALRGEIIYIGDLSVIDHGFVWNTSSNFEVDEKLKKSLGQATELGEFRYIINGEFTSDQIYFIRAFVKSDTYMVYGAELEYIPR